MMHVKKLSVSLAAAIAVAPVSWWLLGEAVVMYYMSENGVVSRAELSDDFGLGILLVAVVPTGTLIVMLLVASLAWRLVRSDSS